MLCDLMMGNLTLLFLLGLLAGAVRAGSEADGCSRSGFPIRGAANQLAAAACTTTTTTHAVEKPACDSPLMASQVVSLCNTDQPSVMCCGVVLMIVDPDVHCLCWVVEEPQFILSGLTVAQVWESYKTCGGHLRSAPRNEHSCEPGSPPPPPPPPAAKPEAPTAWPPRLWIAVGILSLAAIATTIFIGLKLWLPRTIQAPAPALARQMQQEQGQDQDVPTGGVPPGPGEVRPGAEKNAANMTATEKEATSSGSVEEEVSPPLSPPHVESDQLARPQLPPREPFQTPLLPVAVPPAIVV